MLNRQEQLYSQDLYATTTPSFKRLRNFTKVAVASGGTKDVSFVLPVSDLAFVNEQGQWIAEPGDFNLLVGNQSVPIRIE